MYNVFTIANWFLEQEPMNHKKLQKLSKIVLLFSSMVFST